MSNTELQPLVVSAKEAAHLIGVTTARLYDWRVQGIGPKFIKTGPGSTCKVLYPYQGLLDWIEERSIAQEQGK